MALHKSGVGNCHQSLTFGWLWIDWAKSRVLLGCIARPRMNCELMKQVHSSALKPSSSLLWQTCLYSLQFIRRRKATELNAELKQDSGQPNCGVAL